MTTSLPCISFLIGGVQKAGTTALARYLGQHPQLKLPVGKEAHVFDDPKFDSSWDQARIDREYACHFPSNPPHVTWGDATPIYMFHPGLVERIAAYNPAMRWIVLLRDPVERALSHYGMEHQRGDDPWPLWAALAFERWRLIGHGNDWSVGSPMRHWSYRARSDYRRQLRKLQAHFPEQQILVLRNTDLRDNHAAVLTRICHFLGVPHFDPVPPALTAFPGPRAQYLPVTRSIARWLLRRETREYLQL